MSTATKLLILTWVLIGILAAGAAGFYFGRKTAPKQLGPDQENLMMQQGPAPSGQPNMQQSPPPRQGGGQPQQGEFQQPPLGNQQQKIPPSPKP